MRLAEIVEERGETDAKRRTDVGRRLHGCERVLVDGEVVEPALLVEADRGLELRQKLHEHAGIARDPQRLQRIAAEQQLRELAHSVRSETAADPLPGDEPHGARFLAHLPQRLLVRLEPELRDEA